MKVKQYGVWNEALVDDKGEVVDGDYWSLYDSIEDAVSEHGKVTVYRLTAKCVGQYRRAVRMVRVKRRRSSKKN